MRSENFAFLSNNRYGYINKAALNLMDLFHDSLRKRIAIAEIKFK